MHEENEKKQSQKESDSDRALEEMMRAYVESIPQNRERDLQRFRSTVPHPRSARALPIRIATLLGTLLLLVGVLLLPKQSMGGNLQIPDLQVDSLETDKNALYGGYQSISDDMPEDTAHCASDSDCLLQWQNRVPVRLVQMKNFAASSFDKKLLTLMTFGESVFAENQGDGEETESNVETVPNMLSLRTLLDDSSWDNSAFLGNTPLPTGIFSAVSVYEIPSRKDGKPVCLFATLLEDTDSVRLIELCYLKQGYNMKEYAHFTNFTDSVIWNGYTVYYAQTTENGYCRTSLRFTASQITCCLCVVTDEQMTALETLRLIFN